MAGLVSRGVVGALLMQMLGVVVHLVLVPHVLCAVHGTSAHGVHEKQHAAARGAALLAPVDGAEDEHCSMLTAVAPSLPAAVAPIGSSPVKAALGIPAARCGQVPPRQAIWRVAPKQSPPVA